MAIVRVITHVRVTVRVVERSDSDSNCNNHSYSDNTSTAQE